MSRAGVGHLANDPKLVDKGEIGMVLGQNNVRNSEGTGDLEFFYTIDKRVAKVR